jgi:hypothetical protein
LLTFFYLCFFHVISTGYSFFRLIEFRTETWRLTLVLMPPTFAYFSAQRCRFMLSVGDSSQTVQQATTASSQAEACKTDMISPSDRPLIYSNGSEQKDLTDLIPIEQPGVEFRQHEKGEFISKGSAHPLHVRSVKLSCGECSYRIVCGGFFADTDKLPLQTQAQHNYA